MALRGSPNNLTISFDTRLSCAVPDACTLQRQRDFDVKSSAKRVQKGLHNCWANRFTKNPAHVPYSFLPARARHDHFRSGRSSAQTAIYVCVWRGAPVHLCAAGAPVMGILLDGSSTFLKNQCKKQVNSCFCGISSDTLPRVTTEKKKIFLSLATRLASNIHMFPTWLFEQLSSFQVISLHGHPAVCLWCHVN